LVASRRHISAKKRVCKSSLEANQLIGLSNFPPSPGAFRRILAIHKTSKNSGDSFDSQTRSPKYKICVLRRHSRRINTQNRRFAVPPADRLSRLLVARKMNMMARPLFQPVSRIDARFLSAVP
jgi:hypothetical protein